MLLRPYLNRRVVLLGFVLFAASSTFLAAVRQAHGNESALLPNLVADPPNHMEMETSVTEGGISKSAGEPRLLLRFNGYVHNDGAGPLDIHGEREAPNVSVEVEKEVERIRQHNQEVEAHKESDLEELSSQIEKELTIPKMQVTQQLFATNDGAPQTSPAEQQIGETETQYKERLAKFGEENEKYLERASKKEQSAAEMEYVSADGHHHWHLEHVAKYSLWSASKTKEVAPSQKVGFCLEDSEHMEATDVAGSKGPEYPVYSDASPPYRDFCQQYRPNATFVFEGISPGWRDRYGADLGLQWVDVSNVLPGEYWLREEVNPEKTILEEHDSGGKSAFATKPTIVPGFEALPKTVTVTAGQSATIVLEAKEWVAPGEAELTEPRYAIVASPGHGELEPVAGTGEFIYRPAVGYSGLDSFGFTASDPNSSFPRDPEIAQISIHVGAAPTPSVSISGTPAEMLAGTSVQLTALVTNDNPAVTWSADAGSIAPEGRFTAPATAGPVVVTARTAKGAVAQVAISVFSPPVATSTPAATSSRHCKSPSRPAGLCRPQATLIGRELVMTTRATKAGRVDLDAYLGRRLLGGCGAKTPADRNFTCRIRLARSVRVSSKISVLATLRVGREIVRSLRAAAPVTQMKMAGAHGKAPYVRLPRLTSWRFWCGPSMQM